MGGRGNHTAVVSSNVCCHCGSLEWALDEAGGHAAVISNILYVAKAR
jgi:hypothetical protein